MWGFIDPAGRVIAPPSFVDILPFSEGLAAVSDGKNWFYINRSGERVLSLDADSLGEFAEGMATLKRGGVIGYINLAGDVVVEPRFLVAHSFSEAAACVRDHLGRATFIDSTGASICDLTLDDCSSFSNGLAAVSVGGKWGYVDRTMTLVVPPTFEWARPFSKDGLAVVKAQGGPAVIDRSGERKPWATFPSIGDFQDGVATVSREGKCGYIRADGSNVLPLVYTDCRAANDGRLLAAIWQPGGRSHDWVVLDKDGKKIGAFKAANVGQFSNGRANFHPLSPLAGGCSH